MPEKGAWMNAYNVKRLEYVIDKLDELEEEIVPCYAEEEHRSLRLSDMDVNEKEALDERVIYLEEALFFLVSMRDHLKNVLESIEKENDNDKKDQDSDSAFHMPVVTKELCRYNQ